MQCRTVPVGDGVSELANVGSLSMQDRYKNFFWSLPKEKEGTDFLVRWRECPDAVVIVAPHGGGIEPGTSELAEAIAGDDFSFYAFDGIKETGNAVLHITSAGFDEPHCVALVTASPRVVTIHGEDSEAAVVFLGGLDKELGSRIRASLQADGFTVKTHNSPNLQGTDTGNISNRGLSGRGVQLELSSGSRESFFQSLTRSGRQRRTEQFSKFVNAVRRGIM